MRKFFDEFKKFAMRGNVVDMAVGVVIGGAFGKIVSSLVNDIIMPLIGLLIGRVDFSGLSAYGINYGIFIQNIVDFVLIAFSIFVAIKVINRFNRKKEEAAPPPAPDKSEILLEEIRDLLKQQRKQ